MLFMQYEFSMKILGYFEMMLIRLINYTCFNKWNVISVTQYYFEYVILNLYIIAFSISSSSYSDLALL